MGEKKKDALAEFATDMLMLEVPPACQEGVEANLRLLASHARTLETWLESETR